MNDESQTNPIVQVFRASIGKKLEGAPPFTEWLDGRIVSCNPGEIEMTFTVRPEMANPTGLLHGGIQAAIIDDLIGMTAATLGEEGFMLTIDLHVNFLGRVEVGRTVKARARFIRSGKRIAHAVCEILDEQGNIVARGDSNLLKTGYVPDYQKRPEDEG
ncbi:MAG: PaaI family thioesterase [Candidatus Abyssobacteria bacterium SURF_17]|uniref:PaaI family thioesterase n=1 Tax=Candidatus Abyssobacteria bacterium SURF_17 TaxID=2093361 RepID=A0A419F9N6_9BACT|nr:MAG: PaaI family thioesterase [Candidatus Abyssubacteria bacterium SURF_17]